LGLFFFATLIRLIAVAQFSTFKPGKVDRRIEDFPSQGGLVKNSCPDGVRLRPLRYVWRVKGFVFCNGCTPDNKQASLQPIAQYYLPH
jgi:hypothetical protein